MNAAGHSTRYRPEYRKPADNCCLLGASSWRSFCGVAPTPGTPLVVFCSSPDPYTGAKELSYPACRRLRPDTQAQGRVVKLTLTPEVRHTPTPGQPTSYKPKYGEPDAVSARSLFDRAGTGGALCGE